MTIFLVSCFFFCLNVCACMSCFYPLSHRLIQLNKLARETQQRKKNTQKHREIISLNCSFISFADKMQPYNKERCACVNRSEAISPNGRTVLGEIEPSDYTLNKITNGIRMGYAERSNGNFFCRYYFHQSLDKNKNSSLYIYKIFSR